MFSLPEGRKGFALTWRMFTDVIPAITISEPVTGPDGRTRVQVIGWSQTPDRADHYLRRATVDIRFLDPREFGSEPNLDQYKTLSALIAAQAEARAAFAAANAPELGGLTDDVVATPDQEAPPPIALS